MGTTYLGYFTSVDSMPPKAVDANGLPTFEGTRYPCVPLAESIIARAGYGKGFAQQPLELYVFALHFPQRKKVLLVTLSPTPASVGTTEAAELPLGMEVHGIRIDGCYQAHCFADAWIARCDGEVGSEAFLKFNTCCRLSAGSPYTGSSTLLYARIQYLHEGQLLLESNPRAARWERGLLHLNKYITTGTAATQRFYLAPTAQYYIPTLPEQTVLLRRVGVSTPSVQASQVIPLPGPWAAAPDNQPGDTGLLDLYLSADKKNAVLIPHGEANPQVPAGYSTICTLIVDPDNTTEVQLYVAVEQVAETPTTLVSIKHINLTPSGNNPRCLKQHLLDVKPPEPEQPDEPEVPAAERLPTFLGLDTRLDDLLPHSIGFEEKTLSSGDDIWHSPGYLLADRDLLADERVSVHIHDKHTGESLYTGTLTAPKQYAAKEWVAALGSLVNTATPIANSTALPRIGAFGNTGEFAISEATADTAQFSGFTTGIEKAAINRLWCHGERYRVFSTAPFQANQVQAASVPSSDLPAGTCLCVQVRDWHTQRLYESLLFEPAADRCAAGQWEVDLCTAINTQSNLVRAGERAQGGTLITPSATAINALWVPQKSNLSVTLEQHSWQRHSELTASDNITANHTIRVYVHDAISGQPLPGSPLQFAPTAAQLPKAKWPAALAAALKASVLSSYLRLDATASTGTWWQLDVPLRVWWTIADGGWEAVTDKNGAALTLDSLYSSATDCLDIELQDQRTHALIKRLRYNPSVGNYTANKSSWQLGLCTLLQEQTDICLGIGAASPKTLPAAASSPVDGAWKLWLPGESGLALTLLTAVDDSASFAARTEKPSAAQRICSGNVIEWLLCKDNNYTVPWRIELTPEAYGKGVRLLYARMLNKPPFIEEIKNEGEISPLRLEISQWLFKQEHSYFDTSESTAPPSIQSMPEFVAEVGIHIPAGTSIDETIAWRISSRATNIAPFFDEVYINFKPTSTFKPQDSLCTDYSNTRCSELFDSSVEVDNGVDPYTGLFHAHYPVATLQGLDGVGPLLELNLHYSALRANEGALGDGWAFRLSSFDNRQRLLRLANGETQVLSAAEIYALTENTARTLGKGLYQLTEAVVDGARSEQSTRLSSLTVIHPNGRVEVIGKPAVHDGKEANALYLAALNTKLDALAENIKHWLDKEKITDTQKADLEKTQTWITETKAENTAPAYLLASSRITSPQGGTLSLKWEGLNGHVRLLEVRDGSSLNGTCLLSSVHQTPTAQGNYTSEFTVWPNTPETYRVKLSIEDCLLTKLERYGEGATTPVQVVKYGYVADHALDRVLSSVEEEDGSLEWVKYSIFMPSTFKGLKGLREFHELARINKISVNNRVFCHVLAPGAGQANIVHTFNWQTYPMDEVEMATSFYSIERQQLQGNSSDPSITRTWDTTFATPRLVSLIEETPGVVRKTTTHTYPASDDAAAKALPLLHSLPISTTVETTDLSQAPVEEKQA